MDPHVDAMRTEGRTARFRLRGANVSLANALRRVIIAEIPCVVLLAESAEPGDISISRNTSRLNNELIRQRLSCVPVHVRDTGFPVGDHEIELDVENKGDSIIMATTGNFRVKNRVTDTYLTDSVVRAMFPPDPITGDYIDLVRLRPVNAKGASEAIALRCRMGIGTGSQNAAYTVACTCAYAATPDVAAAAEAWRAREPTLKDKGEALAIAKKDWEILGAKRYTVPDSFDFVLESVGQFSNEELVVKAVDVLVGKLRRFQSFEADRFSIQEAEGTMANSYLVKMKGEGYTLGKLIEYALFKSHCEGQPGSDGSLLYCGFRKPHPHIDESVIKVAFREPSSADHLAGLLSASAALVIAAFERIALSFSATS